MNKVSFLLLILCAVAVQLRATASDHDLEDALNHQFKNKILVFRHPTGNKSLRYDADGKSLNRGSDEDWTLYGAVMIQKIELGQNKLRVQGRRQCVRRDGSGLAPFEFRRAKNQETPSVNPFVQVEIGFDQPLTTVDQAQNILGNVFALNKQDFLASVPEFWREYLDRYINDFDLKQGKEIDFKSGRPATGINSLSPNDTAGQPPTSQDNRDADAKVYRVGKDVKAPKARFTPEPEYSEAARNEKFQGTLAVDMVVDQSGKVHNIKMVRPLGFGLDERAVAAVKRWTFDPAVLNGKPVSVEMNVEVGFHLY